MKKLISIVLSVSLILAATTGCIANKPAEATPTATVAADAVTSASVKESSDPAAIANGLSEKGYWIFSILSDVTLTDELNVAGTFNDKGEAANKVYRKFALYAQDADHKVTAEYTLTVPKINVSSPNFKIQNGTVKGDIYVNAEGFELSASKVEGNVVFATQAFKDSAILDKGTISGEVSVAK